MDKLREILVDLLNPEKAAAATARMKVSSIFSFFDLTWAFQEIKSDKSLLPNLMQLTLSDHEASVRQMAAVLLRKDIARKVRRFLFADHHVQFSTLRQEEQNAIRDHILQSLTTEENGSVWSAVAEVFCTFKYR